MNIGEEVDNVDMGSKRRTTCVNFGSMELMMCGDMLFEVLIRLPAKVLFRFKIVSKKWNSTISDPWFARRYAARASLSPQWILISSFACKPIVEPFFREKLPLGGCPPLMNCLDLFTVPQTTSIYHELKNLLVGISDGLFLYGPALEDLDEGQIHSYEIYNPLTCQSVTLPPHQHRVRSVVFVGFVTQVKDNVLENFRVLRIDRDYSLHTSLRYEVYFSEIRQWVCYTAEFNQDIFFFKWETCAVINKVLHWIVRGHILAFDLYNKPDSPRVVSLPVGSAGGERDWDFGSESILFSEHQDRLRYLELLRGRCNEYSLSLWELIDYETGKWHLQHSVVLDDFRCDAYRRIHLRPLCFHPFGSNTMFMHYQKGALEYLLSYDIHAGELKSMDVASEDTPFRIPYILPFFLFVVPSWPVSLKSIA